MSYEVGELKVQHTGELNIGFNYEEVKATVLAITNDFKNLVVTEDGIKDAKNVKARLNGIKTALDNRRKEIKKVCLKPYEDFEVKVKDIQADLDEAISNIDNQVKAFENAEKIKKYEEVKNLWSSILGKPNVDFNLIYNEKWLNKTFKMADIEKDMNVSIEKINSDLNVISRIANSSDDAQRMQSKYLLCLNLERVLNEYSAEQEKLKQIQAEGVKENNVEVFDEEQTTPTTIKVNAENKNYHEVKTEPNETVFEVRMAVYGTQEQLTALHEFIKANNIRIQKI